MLPYLLLCREDSPQRKHDLRRVFNGVRYAARTGGQWRYLPHEYGPWWAVYQQMRRWLDAGVFEALVGDVQAIAREWAGRKGQPTAVCLDSRTLQSTPESGARAGYDGAKRRKGSKVHIAVDTLGHLLALTVTPADGGDREQVAALAEKCSRSPAPRCSWPMWTRATPDRTQPRPPNSTASSSRWSSTRWPNEASCCCRAAGWWNAASLGRHASADSPATTNGSTPPSKASTTSPSPSS